MSKEACTAKLRHVDFPIDSYQSTLLALTLTAPFKFYFNCIA